MINKLELGKVDIKIEATIGKATYKLIYGDINSLERYNKQLNTNNIMKFSNFEKLQIDVAIATLMKKIIDKKIKQALIKECEEHLIGCAYVKQRPYTIIRVDLKKS